MSVVGLARALLKQGDKSKARSLFEQLLDVAPNHASALAMPGDMRVIGHIGFGGRRNCTPFWRAQI